MRRHCRAQQGPWDTEHSPSLGTSWGQRTGSGTEKKKKESSQFGGPGARGLPRLRGDLAETQTEEVWELRGGAYTCLGVRRHPTQVTPEQGKGEHEDGEQNFQTGERAWQMSDNAPHHGSIYEGLPRCQPLI